MDIIVFSTQGVRLLILTHISKINLIEFHMNPLFDRVLSSSQLRKLRQAV